MKAPLLDEIKKELRFQTSRSSGPGGQHVNKVSSRVTLQWQVNESTTITDEQRHVILSKLRRFINTAGTLQLTRQEGRSQLKNKEATLSKLKELLAEAFRPKKKRKPTKPTSASKRKRIDSKKRHGEKKVWRKKI